ncbi:hypothetical protein RDI58_011469 [Solanum bulbocastanum]|uniref:Uncharacterized protein n=1 Tax=Solanum bulbocastanum TaxID=147425 RepID=A0AAN8YKI1_SOLBU
MGDVTSQDGFGPNLNN